MNKKFKYGTVTEAVHNIREKGFNKDFQLEGGQLIAGNERFEADDLKIAVVYRYEGNTDPADECTVYGIETNTGIKGVLVLADGIYADADSVNILKKLHQAKNKGYQEGS